MSRSSQSQRALIRKIPRTSRETPRETPQTPLAIEDSSERKTNPLDDDPDRLMEQALIHSFSINTGKLRGESKVYFQDTVAWAEYSRSNKIGEFRKQARGKGKQEFQKLNVASDFRDLKRWLGQRKLTEYLIFAPMDSEELRQTNCSNETAMYAKYENPDSGMAPDSSWRTAYHGTWFYSLRNVLYHGVLLESRNTHIGHEFWEPGVYVSPKFETAREYARAHQMFNDGNYYRCVLKVVYDPDQVKKERERGGGQVVVPSCAVAIIGVIFCADDPPRKGEERFENWSDDLEVIPAKEIAKEEFIKDQREQESLQPQTSQEVQPKPEEAKVSQNSVEGSARSGRSSSKDENDEKVVEKSKEQTVLRDFFGQYRRPGQAGPPGPPRGQPRHGDHADGGNRRSRSPRTRAPRRTEG